MIVLDSSVLVAYYNQADSQHQSALALMSDFEAGKWGRGVLLEYVYLEVVTVLLARCGLAIAAAVSTTLLNAAEWDIEESSPFFAGTVQGFATQRNTRLSFTDIAVADAAVRLAEGQVATFDAEFLKLPMLTIVR